MKNQDKNIKFIEYLDEGDNYIKPKRKTENEVLNIRLYCDDPHCNKYIKGHEGYNGKFIAETGQTGDLRLVVWYCSDHSIKV